MSTNCALIIIIGMKCLHNKGSSKGCKEHHSACIQFSHIDSILSNDPVSGGRWGWSPGEPDGCGTVCSDHDIIW